MVGTTAANVARSVGCTPNNSDAINRLRPKCAGEAGGDADDRKEKAIPHDLRQDAEAIGAERHPDADFTAPFGHHVGEHAVGADGGEQQREDPKAPVS